MLSLLCPKSTCEKCGLSLEGHLERRSGQPTMVVTAGRQAKCVTNGAERVQTARAAESRVPVPSEKEAWEGSSHADSVPGRGSALGGDGSVMAVGLRATRSISLAVAGRRRKAVRALASSLAGSRALPPFRVAFRL